MTSSSARPRVVLSLPLPPQANARAAAEFDALIPERPMRRDDLLAACVTHRAEGVLIGLGMRLGPGEIARIPEGVKVVATSSVGFDHIDVAAANARNIIITNTPDVLSDATADTTLLLMLGACRRAKEHVRNMDGGWSIRNGFAEGLGVDLTGKTLGIVGMGRIGRAVAQRARGFGMKVLYHNRTRLAPELEQGAEYAASLDALLPRSQVLSLNLPGGQGVLMTREKFALLPKGAVFVNSARGSLVDEDALIEALTNGQLFAAGLDVFQKEPNYDTRLNGLPNTFLLPHIGSATIETRTAMGMRALDNIAAVLSGGEAPDEVKV